jgi:hypothetical protein
MAENDKGQDRHPDMFIPHLRGVALEIHELFLALKGVGFTSKEALTLAGMALTEGVSITVDNYRDDGFLDDFIEDEDGFYSEPSSTDLDDYPPEEFPDND